MEPESSSPPSDSHRRSTPRRARPHPPMSSRPGMAVGPLMPQGRPSYLAALMQGRGTAMLPSRPATAVHPTSGSPEEMPSPDVRGQPHRFERQRTPSPPPPPPPPPPPSRSVTAVHPTSGWSVARRDNEEEQDESWIAGSIAAHAAFLSTSNRPLPYRCPPFPKGGSPTDWLEWNKACRKIYKLAANGCLLISSYTQMKKHSSY
jgi:hypothetical protein